MSILNFHSPSVGFALIMSIVCLIILVPLGWLFLVDWVKEHKDIAAEILSVIIILGILILIMVIINA
ncbi:MAG: hypothetical protein ACTHLB_07755, partial [Parafilimonas sp.]